MPDTSISTQIKENAGILFDNLSDLEANIKAMQEELDDKSKKVVALNKAQIDIERLKREKETLRSEIELDTEKKFSLQLATESDRIKQQLSTQVEFKVAEKEQVINQLKAQLSEAQRQAEQGSILSRQGQERTPRYFQVQQEVSGRN